MSVYLLFVQAMCCCTRIIANILIATAIIALAVGIFFGVYYWLGAESTADRWRNYDWTTRRDYDSLVAIDGWAFDWAIGLSVAFIVVAVFICWILPCIWHCSKERPASRRRKRRNTPKKHAQK